MVNYHYPQMCVLHVYRMSSVVFHSVTKQLGLKEWKLFDSHLKCCMNVIYLNPLLICYFSCR